MTREMKGIADFIFLVFLFALSIFFTSRLVNIEFHPVIFWAVSLIVFVPVYWVSNEIHKTIPWWPNFKPFEDLVFSLWTFFT